MMTYLTTKDEVQQLNNELLTCALPTAVDTETWGVNPKEESPVCKGRILLVSLYNPKWPLPIVVDKDCFQELRPWLESDKPKLLANAKFDMHIFKNEGIQLNGVMFDVITADSILDENRFNHSLKNLSKVFAKYQMNPILKDGENTIYLYQHNKELFVRYAAEDALLTYTTSRIVEDKLRAEPFNKKYSYYDYFMLQVMYFQTVLWKMERRGICFDKDLAEKYVSEMQVQIEEFERQVYQHAGHTFNINSGAQLAKILYDELALPVNEFTEGQMCEECGFKITKKYPTGCPEHGYAHATNSPATSAKALKKLKHPLAQAVLDYKAVVKAQADCKKYIESYNPLTGRIHSSFNPFGARTGRLSSVRPNSQNISNRDLGWPIRDLFVAPPGKILICADYDQLEYKLLAEQCRDPILVDMINKGYDVHSGIAHILFGLDCPVPDVKELYPKERKRAKTLNFGIVYGMGPSKLAESLECSIEEAQYIIAEYFDRFPGIKILRDKTFSFLEMNGYVKTITGRKRRLPHIHVGDEAERSMAKRQGFNFLCQGSAADVVIGSMNRIDRDSFSREHHLDMLLQIHDELVFEIPVEEDLVAAKAFVKNKMENPFEYKWKVPLTIQPDTGRTWRIAKEGEKKG